MKQPPSLLFLFPEGGGQKATFDHLISWTGRRSDVPGLNSSPRRNKFTAMQKGNRATKVLSELVVLISIALPLYNSDLLSLGGLWLDGATCCIGMRVFSILTLKSFAGTAFNLSCVVIAMQNAPNSSFAVVFTVCWEWVLPLMFWGHIKMSN